MNIHESIDATRKGFEESFSSGEFYNKQTQDEKHLQQIIDFLNIQGSIRILDLGVGSGYMSFPIAKKYKNCEVVGLDIVDNALKINKDRAEKENLNNLTFVNYDGIRFPFEDESFDMVITRYVIHHFPDIQHSIDEVSRVLKNKGCFFISDPCPNECDTSRFVDEYMQLRKDGHIKFYTMDECVEICGKSGLSATGAFQSSIRFPKKKDTAHGYKEVLKKHDKAIIDSYELVETDTEIYVTEQVNNMMFVKNKQ